MRVMAIGVNCYYEPHGPPEKPGQFTEWVALRRYRFFKGVASECSTLALGVAELGLWPGRTPVGAPEDPSGLYVTNAVKRYLPSAEGKKAAQVQEAWFTEGRKVFRAELACLADHGALPHLVVVFGRAAWGHVWPEFYGADAPEWVLDYQSQPRDSKLFHYVNVVTVAGAQGPRPLLLVGLTQPSTSRRMSAERMVHELKRQTPET